MNTLQPPQLPCSKAPCRREGARPVQAACRFAAVLAMVLIVLELIPASAAPAAGPDSVRVSDQENIRRECVRYPDTGGLLCDFVHFGTAKVTAPVSAAALGADDSSFDENTTVVLATGYPDGFAEGFGYETYTFRLGDDPNYHRGKRVARIPIIPYGASHPWGYATITWSPTRLNLRVTTKKFSNFFYLYLDGENGRVTRDLGVSLWIDGLPSTPTSTLQVAGHATTVAGDDEDQSATRYRMVGAGAFAPGARPCREGF